MSPKKLKKEIKSIRDALIVTTAMIILDKRYHENEEYLRNSMYEIGKLEDRLTALCEAIKDE